jgi:aminoglycoside phosphotransferase (APT) family kinase protein
MLQPRWKRSLGSCAISIALLGDVIKSFPPLIQRVEFIFEFWGARRQKLQVASHVSLELVERSLATARELAVRPGPRVLLHGDLHAGNVLDGGDHRGLVAVDPRACVGDSAFDLIDWVLADAGDKHRMRQRAEWLARWELTQRRCGGGVRARQCWSLSASLPAEAIPQTPRSRCCPS